MSEVYLTLLRIGPDLKGDEQGILKVMEGNFMKAVFATRENDKNLSYSSLRVGIYEMEHSVKENQLDGTPCDPINCLRPTDLRIKHVLIHRAKNDNPNTLAGCIAPGSWGKLWGFGGSEAAMEELFVALGGYQKKKKVTLKVLSNATGVGLETKDDWWRTK
ncbi:MAG: hypothetical protein R2747_20180 [Pyrinomonadaceae bacterium]